MFKVEVKDTNIDIFEGVSNKSGKPFTIRRQVIYVHLPHEPYPIKSTVSLDANQEAFQVGEYQINPESFGLNRFGEFGVTKLKLMPSVTQTRKSA